MFEHVTILLSIILALAMAHVLSSATELIWERHSVRFYGLHALWMANALFGLLAYWLSIWELAGVKNWTGFEILLQFLPAIVQYFACSLISMRREGSEIMDMGAFYKRQRPAIFTAFSLMTVVSMIQIYVDRKNFVGLGPSDWAGAELPVLLILVATLIAGWARSVWLQWAAGLLVLFLEVLFLAVYAS